jgi:pyruvate/2-oxoglutarate dehydrogenase complex dihydrolipoamide acyltransferase (E2) component
MTTGTVATWFKKKVGDTIKEGDSSCRNWDRQSFMEFESFNSGTLVENWVL